MSAPEPLELPPPPVWVEGRRAVEAVNQAGLEARMIVLDYAAGRNLADFRSLEELAAKVQRAAVQAGLETLEGIRQADG